jgi:SOS response regulatory protein OraA/RecX
VIKPTKAATGGCLICACAPCNCLTRRDYSRAELKSKLAAEAESEEELDAVLATLQTERLLSDERYASPARRGAW